jgi:ADP-heptose:LPS heptosyltransferase
MKLQTADITSIGIFRALQLGDLLCSIPAFRALRKAFPAARICLIGLPWQKILPEKFPSYFDEFIHFPGYPGLPEQDYAAGQFEQFAALMRQKQFDLILQMQGNGTIVNDMLSGLAPKYFAGFYPAGTRPLSPLFLPYPDRLPEPIRHLKLMQHLGIRSSGHELEFPVDPEDVKAWQRLPGDPAAQKYVCIHPGSRGSWRQWPPDYFARVADACYQLGFAVFITGVTSEKPITRAVMESMHHPATDLTGKTDLGSIACLIREAALLIANCTGVSHLAAALRTPSIIISMDGEPHRWGPADRRLHKMIDLTRYTSHKTVYRLALRHLHGFAGDALLYRKAMH